MASTLPSPPIFTPTKTDFSFVEEEDAPAPILKIGDEVRIIGNDSLYVVVQYATGVVPIVGLSNGNTYYVNKVEATGKRNLDLLMQYVSKRVISSG